MLEWKTIKLEGKAFIGMHLILPKQSIYIISSTKCILVGKMFDLKAMAPNSYVFIMEKSNSFEELLTSRVIAMNQRSINEGYHLDIIGKEVLLYQNKNDKEEQD